MTTHSEVCGALVGIDAWINAQSDNALREEYKQMVSALDDMAFRAGIRDIKQMPAPEMDVTLSEKVAKQFNHILTWYTKHNPAASTHTNPA